MSIYKNSIFDKLFILLLKVVIKEIMFLKVSISKPTILIIISIALDF